MDDVRLELTCPGCHERFPVAASQQGKIADCPFCGGWVDVPDLCDDSEAELSDDEHSRQMEEGARQLEEGARQLAENSRQIEQSQRALDLRDRQDARFDALLDRMAIVIDRWESLAKQMSLVIERLGGGSAS